MTDTMIDLNFKMLDADEVAEWKMLARGGEEVFAFADLSREIVDVLSDVADATLTEQFDLLMDIAVAGSGAISRNEDNLYVRRIMRRSYEVAVASGHAGACCNLANMYHDTSNTGTVADYAMARALYELGADRGNGQASVNLGYIYYYGRGCEVDYAAAYECFARAALAENNPEGFWKLGDLYAKGQGVRQSDRQAWLMYLRAYEIGDGAAFVCRAAHHLADYLLTGIAGYVEADPYQALNLYTRAELGYYRQIDAGLTYYQGCLDRAIEGQSRARLAIAHSREFPDGPSACGGIEI